MPLLKRITAVSANGSGGNETSNTPLDLILSSSNVRTGNVLLNCVQARPFLWKGLHRGLCILVSLSTNTKKIENHIQSKIVQFLNAQHS